MRTVSTGSCTGSREQLLVEDGDTAQRSTSELCQVVFELWIESSYKRAHEWNLEWWSRDRALSFDVHDWWRRQRE
jgi:hypothetical protein